MTEEEYKEFLIEMTSQCFSFAEIKLARLPNRSSSGFLGKLFKRKTISPTFRNFGFLGGDEICDFVIVQTEDELLSVANVEDRELASQYSLENKCFLKALLVKPTNIDHPGQLINGDQYTIQFISRCVYPKQTNEKTTGKAADDLVRIVGNTWKALDANMLEHYLDKDFHYKSDFTFTEMSSREEYLYYLRRKFITIARTKNNQRQIGYQQGTDGHFSGVAIKMEYMDCAAFLEVKCSDGRIVSMAMHEYEGDPFEQQAGRTATSTTSDKYSFDNYNQVLGELIGIAGNRLNDYFQANGGKEGTDWAWLQTYPQQVTFQHLCIKYKNDIFCIVVGLFTEIDGQQKFYTQGNMHENLLRECEKNNLTPCLFWIDCHSGEPVLQASYLVDARTHEPISLDSLPNSESALMSDWEIHNIGVHSVCQYLRKQGVSKISYCDVIGIDPQIVFEKDGEESFALVRSIPAGLSSSTFRINLNQLKNLSPRKGYFADVQWNAMLGNNGDFQDKRLYRGDCPWNLVQKIDFCPIEEAIQTYSFIETYESDVYHVGK